MKRITAVVVSLFVLIMTGCAPTGPQVDVEAERAALLAADAEAREAAAAMDTERWIALLTDDAVWLPAGRPRLEGKQAIRRHIEAQFALPGFAVSFPEPARGEVSRAGDLGYTWGSFELTINNPEGNPVTMQGKYAAVRKKQPDGAWKEVLSISNFDQPPASE